MTRQIDIRKLLRAPIWSIFRLINSSFFRMIVVAFILAMPLSYWMIDNWLESFAYHISIDAIPYFQAALGIIALATITTSFQSIRAALENPLIH